MFDIDRLAGFLPAPVRNALDAQLETLDVLREIHDPRVFASLAPSGV